MFLAIRHPDLVRTLTLCEPALIPWLKNLSIEKNVQKGKEVYADYQASLVTPTKAAFEKNDVDACATNHARLSFTNSVVRQRGAGPTGIVEA